MNLRRSTYEAIDMVRDFTLANNQYIGVLPPTSTPIPIEVFLLRARLIYEEFGELSIAVHENNLVGVADALADLLYVVLGTAVSYGLPLEDCWPDLEGSPLNPNLSPQAKSRLLIYLDRDCGVACASAFNCSMVCDCGKPDCEGRTVEEKRWLEAAEALRRVVGSIAAAAEVYGIPLEEVFKEVHRANMSKKLGTTTAGQKYPEGGGKGASYCPPDVEGILRRRAEGDPAPHPQP